jgi:tetratricopeptide (TPR) repeat protein
MQKNRPKNLLGPVLLALLLLPPPVPAHVEKGRMPDPVAVMEYRILLEFKPEDTATRSLLGMALLRQGKLSEAEKEFRLVLRLIPDHFDALDGLGLALLQQQRTAEAVRELQAAVKIRPEDILVHLHLGQALSRNSQTEAARQALQTGLTLLEQQPATTDHDQQRLEFHTALKALPVSAANAANNKE